MAEVTADSIIRTADEECWTADGLDLCVEIPPVPPVSNGYIASLLRRYSCDPLIFLITLTHPKLDTIRLARNNEPVTSRGQVFSPAPFDIKLADETDELSNLSLTIPNVDRRIGRAMLEIETGMEAAIEAVFASNPDDVFKRYARLELHDVSFDPILLQGTLSHRRITHEPFPNRRVIPNKFFAYYRR